jgi:hypothetical protein
MMDKLAIKIFITAMLLQDLLDETEGKSYFKLRVKKHISKLGKDLNLLLDETLDQDSLSILITNAANALEASLDADLNEDDCTVCAECGIGNIIFVGGQSDPITRCDECGAIEGSTMFSVEQLKS